MDIVEALRTASDRFHDSYKVGEADACWPWQRAAFRTGYGRFNVARTSVVASRAMYMLIHGAIPAEMEVCHSCDNRICVNPKHLWLGTSRDNAQDCIAKGRKVLAFGESNGLAKLSPEAADSIRQSKTPHRVLARELGIDEARVRQIRKGDGWGNGRRFADEQARQAFMARRQAEKRPKPLRELTDVAKLIHRAMADRGLKQADLLDICGARGRTSEIVNGVREVPKSMAPRLADRLGIPLRDLIDPRSALTLRDAMEDAVEFSRSRSQGEG